MIFRLIFIALSCAGYFGFRTGDRQKKRKQPGRRSFKKRPFFLLPHFLSSPPFLICMDVPPYRSGLQHNIHYVMILLRTDDKIAFFFY